MRVEGEVGLSATIQTAGKGKGCLGRVHFHCPEAKLTMINGRRQSKY
jgi:hypothetical protein